MVTGYGPRKVRPTKTKITKPSVKKRFIMRESDLDNLSKSDRSNYAQVMFQPLTRDYFEKRVTYHFLRNKAYLADQYSHYEYPHHLLRKLTNIKLYDARYPTWLLKYDDTGQLVVKAGLRQPESRMGIATFVPHAPIKIGVTTDGN